MRCAPHPSATADTKPPRLPLGGNSARKAPQGEGYIKGEKEKFKTVCNSPLRNRRSLRNETGNAHNNCYSCMKLPLISPFHGQQAAEAAFGRQLGEKSPPRGSL